MSLLQPGLCRALFASYYASAYVLRLSQGIHEEQGPKRILAPCALARWTRSSTLPQACGSARRAFFRICRQICRQKDVRRKNGDRPRGSHESRSFFSKLLPDSIVAKMAYGIQKGKQEKVSFFSLCLSVQYKAKEEWKLKS